MSTVRQQIIDAIGSRLEAVDIWTGAANVKAWRTTEIAASEYVAGPVVCYACEFAQEDTVSLTKHSITVSIDVIKAGPQNTNDIWDDMAAVEVAMLSDRRWSALADGTNPLAPVYRVEQGDRIISVATQQFIINYTTARGAC